MAGDWQVWQKLISRLCTHGWKNVVSQLLLF